MAHDQVDLVIPRSYCCYCFTSAKIFQRLHLLPKWDQGTEALPTIKLLIFLEWPLFPRKRETVFTISDEPEPDGEHEGYNGRDQEHVDGRKPIFLLNAKRHPLHADKLS